MIAEYWILYAYKSDELLKGVNEEIKKGWQPLGGVSVTSTGTHNDFVLYAQAIVKYSSDK
jgi:hypothetical protein